MSENGTRWAPMCALVTHLQRFFRVIKTRIEMVPWKRRYLGKLVCPLKLFTLEAAHPSCSYAA